MDHTPFEKWILSDDQPDQASRQALGRHLEGCPDCTQLAQAWQEVHAEISRAPQATPAPGFSGRFAARLQMDELMRQRRITRIVLAGVIAASLLVSVLYITEIGRNLPTPLDAFHSLIAALANLEGWVRSGLAVINRIPLAFKVIAWMAASSSLVFWLLVWLGLVWRLPHRKGVLHETVS